MKTIVLTLFLSLVFTASAFAQEVLEGDKKTACEVIICLAGNSSRPYECEKPLREYFSIKRYTKNGFSMSRTVEARKNFLKLCPRDDNDQKVDSLIDNMAKSAEFCDAAELNKQGQWIEYSNVFTFNDALIGSSGQSPQLQNLQQRNPNQYRVIMSERAKNPCINGKNESDAWHTRTYTQNWIPNDWGNGGTGTCTTDVRYWKVVERLPDHCNAFWDHEYADYEIKRPHLVHGANPWNTMWVE